MNSDELQTQSLRRQRLIVTSGVSAGSPLEVEDELVIGREGEIGLLVDDSKLSRRHALLRRNSAGSLTVDDLGSMNGTFVNGERIHDTRVLLAGDVIRVGDTTIEVLSFVLGAELVGAREETSQTQLPSPTHQVGSPTALHDRPSSATAPPAMLLVGDRRVHISPEGLSLGRAPESDIVLDSELASRSHARVGVSDGRHFIADLGSLNGTYLNGERLLNEARWLSTGDSIVVGQEAFRFLTGQDTHMGIEAGLEHGVKAIRFDSRRLTIGRDSSNDVQLQSPTISRHHAEIVGTNGEVELHDLGSRNGTRLDGERVTHAPLRPGSEVGIGPYRLVFDGQTLHQRDDRGVLRLDAYDISVVVQDKVILDPMSLSIQPGEFVAVIGESGSGKTTLLRVLAGVSRPSRGAVLLNGESIRTRLTDVGYLPQDEIVHPLLSVLESLRYSARLRLPSDSSSAEVEEAAARAIRGTGLEQHAQTRIGSLSGGQRKRVGLATELLSSPGLLFLDEPTTGLDPVLETRMMELFRELAAVGSHAVFVVTHATRNLELADRLCVMGRGGQVCFLGKPDDAKQFFGVASFDEIYTALDARPTEEWRRKFEQTAPPAPPPTDLEKTTSSRNKVRIGEGAARTRQLQALVMTQRYLKTFLRDRRNLLLVLLQAPFIGAVIAFLFAPDVFALPGGESAASAAQLLFTLVVTMSFVGTVSSSREIIKERGVLTREHALGVRTDAYLASKLAVLAPLAGVQAALLAAVVFWLRPLSASEGKYAAIFIVLAFTGLAAVAIGLCISALVRTEEQAMALIPIAMIFQLLFGGALVTVEDMGELVVPFSALVFSRWAFAGIGQIVGMNDRILSDPVLGLNNPYGLSFFDTPFFVTVGLLAGFAAVFVVLSAALLRRRAE